MIKINLEGKDVRDTPYSNDKILLDTNLLVFAHDKDSLDFPKASCIFLASLQGDLKTYVSSQNLFEFYSVMTKLGNLKPSPDPTEIGRICADIFASQKIRKIYPQESITSETIQLARKKKLKGPIIYDCLLAVTAKQNHIDKIWTDNVSDLENIEPDLSVENPLELKWELKEEPGDKR